MVSSSTAERILRSSPIACRSRSPGVLGELTFTTKKSAAGPTCRALTR
ncbi:Uncharacterised protein [Mycobacteroides abscessus subsp. abscessus]|nr:Uncharacterised protein [Mycobacteroides abscessus subsp. abscessus]SKV64058.1 Uncharacterised protein [Mycobacteroides abscessus subsp. abscessus]